MSILTDAAVTAVKQSAGPTQYRPLRDPIHDGEQRYQLAARVSDGEPFVLAARDVAGSLVDRINDRNVKRAALDTRIKTATDEKPDTKDKRADRDKRVETLRKQRTDLPRTDAFRCGPVARALSLYADAEQQPQAA